MKASRTTLLGCLAGGVFLVGSATAARADNGPPAALAYFAGDWFCSGSATTPEGNTISTTGTLAYQPWHAWYISAWDGAGADSFMPFMLPAQESPAKDPNDWHWPAHGGHGPVVHPTPPPHGSSSPIATEALVMTGYDSVAQSYNTFKFLPSGTYYQASSEGPTADTWVWSGAISDAGTGTGTGASFRSTVDVSNPNTFTTVTQLSTDLGQTWTDAGKSQCFRK